MIEEFEARSFTLKLGQQLDAFSKFVEDNFDNPTNPFLAVHSCSLFPDVFQCTLSYFDIVSCGMFCLLCDYV